MLAPLENRARVARNHADPQTDLSYLTAIDQKYVSRLETENEALLAALRQSRRNQRRNASLAARKIVAQENEISRLAEIANYQRNRLNELESGQAIIELGRKLVQLSDDNHVLKEMAQRVWFLEKTIRAAHAECERLCRERDCLRPHPDPDNPV